MGPRGSELPIYSRNLHFPPAETDNSGSVSPDFFHYIMAFGIERRNTLPYNIDRDKFVRCQSHLCPFFLISAQAIFFSR